MRIKTFCKYIEEEAVTDYTLNNTTLVIDGHNFFHRLYTKSGIQFVFGCDSDKYATFLRKYLIVFKKANVKCYFIFMGGHEDDSRKLEKIDNLNGKQFVVGEEYDSIIPPVFMKIVYKQILDEMGFDYVVCEYESKRESIAFAQKYKCPIMSFDIEFCFSGVPYIPYATLYYFKGCNKLECKIFKLDNFLRMFRLTEEKLAIFIVLTDQNIFPEDNFLDFIKSLEIPLSNYKRNAHLLRWLSNTNREHALNSIFNFNEQDKETFLENEAKMRAFIRRQETTGLPTAYLENRDMIEIKEKDPLWFQKGIAMGHIPIRYVNLYRCAVIRGSIAVADNDADDAMLLSAEIIHYSYNLLTNFRSQDITLITTDDPIIMPAVAIQKPNYEANESVFENGWSGIRSLKLLEHFLVETLQGFRFQILEKLPEDARLLMIALIYFSRKKSTNTTNEVYSVLLSYVALSIVFEANNNDNNIQHDLSPKAILDSTTDKDFINDNDKATAAALIDEYLGKVNNEEAKRIFDAKLIHPLVEFQHCLQHFNYLNRLCGCPYAPTVYSQVYNGTCVYRVLRDIHTAHAGDGLSFLKKKLNPAATVLAFMNGLIETYEGLLTA